MENGTMYSKNAIFFFIHVCVSLYRVYISIFDTLVTYCWYKYKKLSYHAVIEMHSLNAHIRASILSNTNSRLYAKSHNSIWRL